MWHDGKHVRGRWARCVSGCRADRQRTWFPDGMVEVRVIQTLHVMCSNSREFSLVSNPTKAIHSSPCLELFICQNGISEHELGALTRSGRLPKRHLAVCLERNNFLPICLHSDIMAHMSVTKNQGISHPSQPKCLECPNISSNPSCVNLRVT